MTKDMDRRGTTSPPLPVEHLPEGETPHALLEPAAVLHGGEASCATLTPLIRARLRELENGQVLEVITAEPTAEADITSWSNLTGNSLLGQHGDGQQRHFFLRKK
jgi:TusA-related sulfurtransferase